MSDESTQVVTPEPDQLDQPDTASAEADAHARNTNEQPSAGEDSSHRMVPVAESIRYRKRAQAAEQELETLRSQFDESQSELAQMREAVSLMERRQKIDALLSDADAVDFEVARLLTEAAVEAMEEPDVALAIEELRRSKPYLFVSHAHHTGQTSAMGVRGYDAFEPSDQAAAVAARSGDRRDLLRYLRLRRNGQAQTA